MTKIAVITTELLKDFASKILDRLELDCEFNIYLYKEFSDIIPLFQSLPQDCHGVVTSGVFPAQVIRRAFPDTDKIISAFNNDDVSLYRMLLQLMDHGSGLDLSRIFIDFIDIAGVSTREYLLKEGEDGAVYNMDYVVRVVGDMELDSLIEMEHAVAKKHLELWDAGKIDLSITRFSSIVPDLKSHGVNIHFSYPSKDYVFDICQKLLNDIRIKQFKDNQPAVINVSVRTSPNRTAVDSATWELRLMDLQKALMDYNGTSLLDFVLQKNHYGFEVFTNRKTVEKRTNNFKNCSLKEYLNEHLSMETCIGYGIGNDIYQARLNAINANKEATFHPSGASYLIDDQERLIGPLAGDGAIIVNSQVTPRVEQVAKGANLSTLTVAKVQSVLDDLGTDRITAQDLALKLSITIRSANRFLKGLTQAGAAEILHERNSNTRGRPERVYRISILER